MRRAIAIIIWAILQSWSLSAQDADRVTRVVDGDTVILEKIGVARLIGVDTPETVHPQQPVEAFGKEASDFTRKQLQGKAVRIEYDFEKRDRYQRALVYLYLEDGTFFNAELVKQGYAHAYTQFPFKFLEDFRKYEREAREAGRGLWADQVAEKPQEQPQSGQVYVTRTGTKYHRVGCRYLARSQIPIDLSAAAASYGPCSVCKPPFPAPSNPSLTPSGPSVQPAPASRPQTSGRCQATTQKGAQCKRAASAGSSYCWQHGR